MPIFATEYTEIDCFPGFTVDTDLFSVDLVVALDGDVECLFYPSVLQSTKSIEL